MRPTKGKITDIRLSIVILSECIGHDSTIRFYDMIVSTNYVALATYRPDHDQSKDIQLATVYHTSRRIRPTKGRTTDIRLVIVILSGYVGHYSTIRFYGMIVSTSYVRRLVDTWLDVHA